MGLMKGGLPSFRRPSSTTVPGASQPTAAGGGGVVVSPVQILSVNLFALGIVLLIVGVDALLVPAYLIYKNIWYGTSGILLTAAGTIALAWGLRRKKPE